MYTVVYIPIDDAEKIYAASCQFKSPGSKIYPRLAGYFAEFSEFYAHSVGATMVRNTVDGKIVALRFNQYLPDLPEGMKDVRILKVEIMRTNSVLTRAKAGYYRSEDGFEATVESTVVAGREGPNVVVVQNIRLEAPTLGAANDYNSRLSTGGCDEFLEKPFG